MSVVTFTKQKGGVGNTATVVNVAKVLADIGDKVLIIDMDPQGNASKWFGVSPTNNNNTANLLLGKEVAPSISQGVSIIPSNKELSACESRVSGQYDLLKNSLIHFQDYDVVLVDTPPTLGFFTINSLVASRYAVCVASCTFESLEQIKEVKNTVLLTNSLVGSNCILSALIITLFNKGQSLDKHISKKIKSEFSELFIAPMIRKNVSVSEAYGYQKPVVTYMPESNGAKDYISWATNFKSRGYR
jgi:chromosome partitioning protein